MQCCWLSYKFNLAFTASRYLHLRFFKSSTQHVDTRTVVGIAAPPGQGLDVKISTNVSKTTSWYLRHKSAGSQGITRNAGNKHVLSNYY